MVIPAVLGLRHRFHGSVWIQQTESTVGLIERRSSPLGLCEFLSRLNSTDPLSQAALIPSDSSLLRE